MPAQSTTLSFQRTSERLKECEIIALQEGEVGLAQVLASALHHLEAGKRKIPDGNFTKRTLKILNDIAEDVDCGESKKVLRETIAEMAHEWEAVTQQEHLKRMDRELEVLRKLSDQMDAYSKSKEAQPTTPTEEPQG